MNIKEDRIELGRELSRLDRKVLEFVDLIESEDLDYVIVSGYVAILLGRSRGSEDVDMILDFDEESFNSFWNVLRQNGYWCINGGREEAWELLQDGMSARFAEENEAVPNFEVFIPQDEFDSLALSDRISVELGDEQIWISPLELQICYKLMMGSEKDFEDALHIYIVAKENLEPAKLDDFGRGLEVGDELGELESEAKEG